MAYDKNGVRHDSEADASKANHGRLDSAMYTALAAKQGIELVKNSSGKLVPYHRGRRQTITVYQLWD